MHNTGIVILAAGSGSRLGFEKPKPLVPLLGKPLIQHLLDNLPANIPTYIIVSPAKRLLFQQTLGNGYTYLTQDTPKGTGHALIVATPHLTQYQRLIILNADTPQIPKKLIEKLIYHPQNNILVGFETTNTQQYGQIVHTQNIATKIIEAKDRKGIHYSNICYSGIMSISQAYLQAISNIKPSDITGEYYLTSLVSPQHPFAMVTDDPQTLLGVNTPEELLSCERSLKSAQLQRLFSQDTHIDDYQNFYICANSKIGKHCYVGRGCHITNSRIQNNCHIGQGAILENTTLGEGVIIHPYSIIRNTTIDSDCSIGPFAHIQEHTIIKSSVCIGNFVEIKRAYIHKGVKAKHLSYLADVYIDQGANIGAGVITCNYVPWRPQKSLTYIGAYALVGANCALVAPIHIGDYAICAAGSTITQTVLPKTLALSRAPTKTILNWREPALKG